MYLGSSTLVVRSSSKVGLIGEQPQFTNDMG